MDEIALLKTLSRFDVLEGNLPKGDIEEKYVSHYHEILRELERLTTQDLKDFLIPEAELKQSQRGAKQILGGGLDVKYSKERYCDRAFFMLQLKGAMRFFEYLGRKPEKPPIGFR